MRGLTVAERSRHPCHALRRLTKSAGMRVRNRVSPLATSCRTDRPQASRFDSAQPNLFAFGWRDARLEIARSEVAEVEPGHVLIALVANLVGPRLKDDDVVILACDQVLDIECIGAIEGHASCAPLGAKVAMHATQRTCESEDLGLTQEQVIGAA